MAGLIYIVVSFCGKQTRESGVLSLEAIESGVRNTMGVSLACGLAGIVAGIVTLTSLGSTLIGVIVPIAKNNLFLALFLTMVACIVLGMGVPTTANYLIMATITAPIMIQMGLPTLAAHMFVFFQSIQNRRYRHTACHYRIHHSVHLRLQPENAVYRCLCT